MVRYKLPSVGTALKLDRNCPHCGRGSGRIHSGVCRRGIRDWKVQALAQRRMRCPWCGLTWTLRAEGVRAGRQRSDRLVGLGVLAYMLGMSYRQVAMFLGALDCPVSKSSIERDVSAAGLKAQALHRAALGKGLRVRVLGVDGTGVALAGRSGGMLFFVDIAGGRLLAVEVVGESDSRAVRKHVLAVMSAVGAEEVRTDEHPVYERAVGEAHHRLCLTHWRKSKLKRAMELYRQGHPKRRIRRLGVPGGGGGQVLGGREPASVGGAVAAAASAADGSRGTGASGGTLQPLPEGLAVEDQPVVAARGAGSPKRDMLRLGYPELGRRSVMMWLTPPTTARND